VGGIFKKKDGGDPIARLVEVMAAKVPAGWSGANVTVVPRPGGAAVLVTNAQNDEEELAVNQEMAETVMRVIELRQPASWRAAQLRLTRKEAEWDVDVHFE
jgi:hypothetical protein